MEGDQEVEVSGNNQVDMDLVGEAMEERRVCIKGNITQLEEMIIKIGEVLVWQWKRIYVGCCKIV